VWAAGKVEVTLMAQATGIKHCLAVAVRACLRGLLKLQQPKAVLYLLAPTFRIIGVVALLLGQQLAQQLRQILYPQGVKWAAAELARFMNQRSL
jgi:xanthosine utilization system XapX-like protein